MNWIANRAFELLKGYSRIAPTGRGAYRLVRAARQLLPQPEWKSWFETPDHVSLALDLGTYPDCCMSVGLYELDTYRTIRRLLRPGDWFVDCGANIGYFTLCAAKWVGNTGRVDAYEPDPINRLRLEEHLHRNGVDTIVRVHRVGVSSKPGSFDFYHPSTSGKINHGSASLFASLVEDGEKFTIETVRMDQHLDGVPNLIKMDIEGAEYDAIEGMSKILASSKPPHMIIEHNLESIAASGHKAGDVFSLLRQIQPRYKIYWIGWRLQQIPSVAALESITRQGNLLVSVD